MLGEYTCSYLHNSGNVCGRSCMRSEGCNLHWKVRPRFPCKECDKPTASLSGRCSLHVRGYYVSRHYFKLRKLASLANYKGDSTK